ncbi:MAG: methyl-accepting chemotaxis protein [Spirochaetales bacterium]|nr:methyl-accepting chemotaxis protein [Spirochaetales bacterium]
MRDKKTIGFMTRSIGTPVGFTIWQGVKKAAQKHGVNLITIDGDNVGRHRTLIFELMKKNNVDGVLTWASNTADEKTVFYSKRIGDIPIVTLTLPIDSYPVVQIDSYTGMKLAVKHLIEVHGRDKIVFIPGNETNNYYNERFQGYKDALKEAGVAVNPQLIGNRIPPDSPYDEYYDISTILDDIINVRKLVPGKDFNGIITVTEGYSLVLFDYFRKKGISVPEDVSIISYDNSTKGRYEKPTPTAMILPFDEQSEQGFHILMDQINGKPVERFNKIPSHLQVNLSCGCEEKSLDLAATSSEYKIVQNCGLFKKASEGKEPTKEELELTVQECVNAFLAQIDRNTAQHTKLMKSIEDYSRDVVSSLINELIHDGSEETMKSLDRLIELFVERKVPLKQLQNLVSIFRNIFILEIDRIDTVNRAENIFHKLRTNISVSIDYFEGKKLSDRDKDAEELNSFSRILAGKYSHKDIFEVITKRTPLLNIGELYLVMYPERVKYEFLDPMPEKSTLIYGVKKGKALTISEKEREFSTLDILPSSVMAQSSKENVVIMPLFSNMRHMGFLVFMDSPNDRHLYAAVRDFISSALQGAYMMTEMEKAEKESAENLVNLKQKAEVITVNTESINTLIQSITEAMENIGRNVKLISDDITSVARESNTVVKVTDEANGFVDKLNKKANDISAITNLISDLSEKTDVLSINARIEAARAGADGKGFSVVANEIKELSQQTNESTQKINEMIGEIQSGSGETLSSMSSIHSIIQKIYSLTEDINVRIDEHLKATQDISSQLIEASQGSREIYSAISQVAGEADL